MKVIIDGIEYVPLKTTKLELEDKNVGRPINKLVEINPEKASETEPQAWEHD